MANWIGLSLLTDRESGWCILTTAWENGAAMQSSADQVRPLRDRLAEAFQAATTVDERQIAAVHRDHHSGEGALRAGHVAQGPPGPVRPGRRVS